MRAKDVPDNEYAAHQRSKWLPRQSMLPLLISSVLLSTKPLYFGSLRGKESNIGDPYMVVALVDAAGNKYASLAWNEQRRSHARPFLAVHERSCGVVHGRLDEARTYHIENVRNAAWKGTIRLFAQVRADVMCALILRVD